MIIEKLLIAHEGERLKPYRCTEGYLTIGIGRNLDSKGITKEEARYMLQNDIDECVVDLSSFIFQEQFSSFPENVKLVLIDMRFQLGFSGFRGFKKMIAAFKSHNLEAAIIEMKNSKWYTQTRERADDLIGMLL